MLAACNLRLHKIASSHSKVTEAFPKEDQDLISDLSEDAIPIQLSLRVLWDIANDAFTFGVSLEAKPFTNGVLCLVIDSLHYPLGLAAPDLVKGKFLLGTMLADQKHNPLE